MHIHQLSSYFRGLLEDDDQIGILARRYKTAKPFPHIVLSDVFAPHELRAMENVFPKPDSSWWEYNNALERKFAKDDLTNENIVLRHAVETLQSAKFTKFLTKLTGIEGLIVDNTLRGGGLHQIATGGKLDVHVDFNKHPETHLDRRLNVILYLNSGWDPKWGGQLELWNKDMDECQASIVPAIGTMVIFSTTEISNHGHPNPLTCPEGTTRKSIATYLYTNGRPANELTAPHSTIFKARPQDEKTPELEQLRTKRAKGRINKESA